LVRFQALGFLRRKGVLKEHFPGHFSQKWFRDLNRRFSNFVYTCSEIAIFAIANRKDHK